MVKTSSRRREAWGRSGNCCLLRLPHYASFLGTHLAQAQGHPEKPPTGFFVFQSENLWAIYF
jgi:hypothetical protein